MHQTFSFFIIVCSAGKDGCLDGLAPNSASVSEMSISLMHWILFIGERKGMMIGQVGLNCATLEIP